MKTTLRVLALLVAVGAIGFWVAGGANRGWSRTSEAVRTVDEVTGIEGIEYRQRFVPGLEILGGALLGAGLLAAASFLIKNQRQPQKSDQNV